MKVSASGLQVIVDRGKAIIEKLNAYASRRTLNAEQREDFRDLQQELLVTQRQYRAFSNPDSGK